MNLNFKFDFTDVKNGKIHNRTTEALISFTVGWADMCKTCVMHMTCYPLNKYVFWHQDPDTPGRSPETPDRKSGESGLWPGVSGSAESKHKKQIITQLNYVTY